MVQPAKPERWSQGRVYALRQWTKQLYSVQVEADVQPFIAGQFTKLGLPVGDTFIERPYSYVNAPDTMPLEFYFITVPDGPLTHEMIKLQAGNPLWVMRKASGFLTLNEVPDARDLWLLSTGTAIGPFLSMLHTAEPWERFERVVLVHAVRYARELSFADSIAALLSRHGGRFHFIPFVSREPTGFALPGRITTALANRQLEARAETEISPEHSQVMICGNPEMVKETSALLNARGLQRNRRREPGHITVENYW